MKYLILLFALYFTSLAAMPCGDSAASHGECGTEVHEQEAADHHPDEPSEESCSPFCTCHCCKIHKAGVAATEGPSTPLQKESKGPLTPVLLSKEFFSVWHPPKA